MFTGVLHPSPREAPGALHGRRVLVTAGPTREPIDPVRFISNHSSGKMGVAIAAAAPHRTAAFAASRYVIEEVKRRVPIWKREHYADGTVGWVDPTQARRRPVSQAAQDAPAGSGDAAGQDEWGV